MKAVEAFGEMMPVFRHPRCLNCHGGVDPHSEKHRGVDQLDADLTLFGNRPAYLAQCQECHDGLPGWMVPPIAELMFVGKSDEQLCLQMKEREHTGEEFVGHIFNDHGAQNVQFIAAAFVGDRALGEGMRDYELVAEPPPGTQADLTEKARKWVEMLGEGYTASPECGCVMPKIKLKIHHTEEAAYPRGVPSKEASEALFEVSLLPMGDERPGHYQGAVSLDRTIELTLPRSCRGTASRQERWELYARLDPESGDMTVWRTQMADEPAGGIECAHGTSTAKTGLFPGAAVSMLGFGELVIPADSTSKRLTAEYRGTKESLTITVLELPAGE